MNFFRPYRPLAGALLLSLCLLSSPEAFAAKSCKNEMGFLKRAAITTFALGASTLWVAGLMLEDPALTPARPDEYPNDAPFLLHPNRVASYVEGDMPGEAFVIEGLASKIKTQTQPPQIILGLESHACMACNAMQMIQIHRASSGEIMLGAEGAVFAPTPIDGYEHIYGIESEAPFQLTSVLNKLYELQTIRRQGGLTRLAPEAQAAFIVRATNDFSTDPLFVEFWKNQVYPELLVKWEGQADRLQFLNTLNDELVGVHFLQSARALNDNIEQISSRISSLIEIRKALAKSLLAYIESQEQLAESVGEDDLRLAQLLVSQARDITPRQMAEFEAGLSFEEREIAMAQNIAALYLKAMEQGLDLHINIGAAHGTRLYRALRASLDLSGGESVVVEIDAAFLEHEDIARSQEPYFVRLAEEVRSLTQP